MNRFEQLIEYVINDEEAKAQELFHEIVVEKSRQIYENIMAEETEELDEDSEELDEDAEEVEESMGGDSQNDLIDDVEMEEENDMSMESEGDEVDFGDEEEDGGDEEEEVELEIGGGDEEPATKDDILNLEDKLDQLMAEFEASMGGDEVGNGDGFGPEEGGDAIEMDDTAEMEPGMMEAVSLKAAPKPVTSEQGNGKAGPVAFNAGAAGMAAKPVRTTGGDSAEGKHDTSAYKNSTKDLIGKVGNSPAQSTQDPKPATKPHLSQATGVNNTSPLPSGRKG